jgi:uncharacterized BrkB/YihY/UPF0761 family membrane protein
MNTLVLVIGWTLTILIGLLGLIIVWLIISRRIDLSKLLSEPDGFASLSRFQFLIFTFVIAMSLFLIIVSNQPLKFPDVPGGILALLGISGGSYVVAKGIQTSREVGIMDAVYGKGTGDGKPPATVGVAAAVTVPPVPPKPEV